MFTLLFHGNSPLSLTGVAVECNRVRHGSTKILHERVILGAENSLGRDSSAYGFYAPRLVFLSSLFDIRFIL